MAGEAAVSDPIGLAWAASLASIAVAVVPAGHAVVYKRDPRSPRNPRPGAAACRPLRPPGAGGPARQEGAAGHPEGSCQEGDAGPGCRPRTGSRTDHGLFRRGPRQSGQRGGAGGEETPCVRRGIAGLHRDHRAHRAGLEKKSRVLNPKERETVAHHEMGHALVALALPETDPVHKISIIPRGIGALGYTLQRPTEDRFLMTRTDLEHKIVVLLGGRAAEKLVFGELSTGAADDLARATDIARDMITRFGMDEGLGYIAFEAQRPRFVDTPELAHGGCRVAESTQARIDQAIRDIVMGVFEHAYRILDINRAVLERCARELLARETLDESDIRQLTQGLVRN